VRVVADDRVGNELDVAAFEGTSGIEKLVVRTHGYRAPSEAIGVRVRLTRRIFMCRNAEAVGLGEDLVDQLHRGAEVNAASTGRHHMRLQEEESHSTFPESSRHLQYKVSFCGAGVQRGECNVLGRSKCRVRGLPVKGREYLERIGIGRVRSGAHQLAEINHLLSL
jgi:hypothetical protein